jgi:hypothetical protein
MGEPWHYTTLLDAVDHWQTLLGSGLAVLAALGTIWVTRTTAYRQIAAGHAQADSMVAAAREQTSVTAEQTAMTARLQRMRDIAEARAFSTMLEAAMSRVLAEADWARKTYPNILKQKDGSSKEALSVRNAITKGAFPELRGACIRQGSGLTSEFLELEREIDNFAQEVEDIVSNSSFIIRMGKHAGLGDQLDSITLKATALRERARTQLAGPRHEVRAKD